MISYILIGLLSLSIFSLGAFYFAINLLNKRKEKKNIDIRNTFPFEKVPFLKTDNFFINILYFLSILAIVTGIILFMTYYLGVVTIFIGVISIILLFFLVTIPFVSINKLKEHLYLDVGLVVTYFALSGFITYLSYSICKLTYYHNATAIASLVVSALIFLFSLCFVANPRLFDLRMQVKEDDVERPKIIPLAFSEWLLMLSGSLFLVPLILLSTVL